MPRPHKAPTKPNGISKRTKPSSNLFERRLKKRTTSTTARNPALAAKLSQMRLTLAPIVHAETGLSAPDYPATMLSLFLLTEAQLDRLASFYSQSSPSQLSHAYPATMNWTHPFLDTDKTLPAVCRLDDLERLKVKMRMFARFIGLRGAETPGWEYERQVQILGEKVRWRVRMEEGEEQRRKAFERAARWI